MNGCIELLKTIKKLTPNANDRTTDDEANSLWATYYAQYLDSIWALIDTCESSKSYFSYEDIFLPLGLLTAHYMELWLKTISRNYGIGDFKNIDAVHLSGHRVSELSPKFLASLSQEERNACDKQIDKAMELYEKLKLLAKENIDLSEAMRYPVDRKGNATLMPQLLENIEWQEFDFDYVTYIELIKNLLHLTENVYGCIFKIRIH